ncbi:TetR/AcrR family transcriptional regulator [Actinoplanes sp. CA-131856]
MPRIVDHAARRAQISAATWRVIERGGLPAVTLRSVAQEAGIALGVLGHYFASKEDILLDAHRMAYDRAIARVVRTTAGLEGLAALREALLQALPLDEDRRLEARIDIAFIGLTLTDPRLLRTRRESGDALRRLTLGCLAQARERGELRDGLDDSVAADACLTLIDGASIMGLLHTGDPAVTARLTALVDDYIGKLAR